MGYLHFLLKLVNIRICTARRTLPINNYLANHMIKIMSGSCDSSANFLLPASSIALIKLLKMLAVTQEP